MSTLKVNNLQVGQDATSTNNFTLYQPATPNGTVRLGAGNVGGVADILTFNYSGYVGIGNTQPSYRFQVGAPAGVQPILQVGQVGISNGYTINSDGTWLRHDFYSASNIALSVYQNKVGIGSTLPVAKLQIQSSSGGDDSGLRITRTDTGGGDWRIWSTANVNSEGSGKLVIGNSGNRVIVDSSGNVGIATTNPSTLLSVHTENSYGTATNNVITISNVASGGDVNLPQNLGAIRWLTFQATGASIESFRDLPSGGNGSSIVFSTNAGGNNTTASERFRIHPNGNVSIANGNLVFSTSGKGIDFSADPNAAGMTSELLNDYETGTWTPTDISTGVTFTSSDGMYTKIGRVVIAHGNVQFPVNSNGFGIGVSLPFVAAGGRPGGFVRYTDLGTAFTLHVNTGLSSFSGYYYTGSIVTNAQMSNKRLDFEVIYFV